MGEELEIETRALVTKEIQSVDENEKLLYSVGREGESGPVGQDGIEAKVNVQHVPAQKYKGAVEVHLVAKEVVSEYQTAR